MNDMQPLDDEELNGLLKEWRAPMAPASLERRVLARPVSPWRWLVTGSIRIPVPLGIAAVVLLVLWVVFGQTAPPPAVQVPNGSTLADFQPVEQLEPSLVEIADESP
jgi:hypothetical protein